MEPTRADFEAMQRGDKAASERIHGHVHALREADPRHTYQEHLTVTRARAFAGPKPPTPSREDFEAAERGGNPDAKARIATHVQWRLAVDPLTRYSEHYANLKAEASRVTIAPQTVRRAAVTTTNTALPSRVEAALQRLEAVTTRAGMEQERDAYSTVLRGLPGSAAKQRLVCAISDAMARGYTSSDREGVLRAAADLRLASGVSRGPEAA